jgi:ATP-dependent DNA helicase RecG
MTRDLSSLAAELRLGGGDTTAIEVKAAAGGLPDSLTPTLSALANLPGGGTVILGLDERAGFRPVPLADPQVLKQGLAAKARGFIPPVRLDVDDATVDGAPRTSSDPPSSSPTGCCVPWMRSIWRRRAYSARNSQPCSATMTG